MSLFNLINGFMPKSYSELNRTRATVITITSLAIGGSMLLLVLYWVATKSFEDIETIFAMLIVMLLLAICVGLVMKERVVAGAWMLITLLLLMNFANMASYGISTSASAAYIIPILLAIFCLDSKAGWVVTILGCILVFTIPILQSEEIIETVQAFMISSLTFDAPALTVIYLLVATMADSWAGMVKKHLRQSRDMERRKS